MYQKVITDLYFRIEGVLVFFFATYNKDTKYVFTLSYMNACTHIIPIMLIVI
jgi:hypothetical protein